MYSRYSVLIGLWVLCAGFAGKEVWAAFQLDDTFGLDGRVAVELGVKNSGHAVLVQPDGKIVVAGSTSGAKGTAMNFALLRFNPDGSLDPTFNGEGSAVTSLVPGDDEALALGLLADGRIVAGGYSHNGTDRDFAVACYRRDGSLDPTFGVEGAVLTSIGNGNEEITALVVDQNDNITVVGSSEGTVGRILVAARYTSAGVLDSSFGEQGVSLIGVGEDANAEGLVERRDGSLVISGSYVDKQGSAAMLVGLRANGLLETTFGSKGIATVSPAFAASEGYGISEDGDGLLYLAGAVGNPGRRDAALFRFTPDGQAEGSFGRNGAVVSAVTAEDDVLYDVSVGPAGVAASGFAVHAGARQFLLISYLADGSIADAAAGAGQAAGDPSPADAAPIQEVRVNGQSKVQIRRLQVWNSEVRIQPLQMSDTAVAPPTAWLAPADFSGRDRGAEAGLARIGRHLEGFFLPSAWAADSEATPRDKNATVLAARTVTTAFSEGESLGFALTTDAEGDVIVVGTAEGREASSIVAARFVAADLIDRITDQPGHRSSHITTSLTADITRTTVATGGEIGESFAHEVVRRGVVFSRKQGPVYKNEASAGPTSLVPGGMLRQLGAFFAADAVAAESAFLGGTKSVGEQGVEAGRTDNGAGKGAFSVLLEHLRPGTVYYIRAYALTAGGAVYYGNQISIRTADACFIATASFGSLLHPCVSILRDFRDACLLGHPVGTWLVDLYYTFSPPLADAIADNAPLRQVVRLLLLPVIGFSWLALQIGLAGASCAAVALTAIAAWAIPWPRRRG